jgi:hypothetical protein
LVSIDLLPAEMRRKGKMEGKFRVEQSLINSYKLVLVAFA